MTRCVFLKKGTPQYFAVFFTVLFGEITVLFEKSPCFCLSVGQFYADYASI
jgi:hypothetical protein